MFHKKKFDDDICKILDYELLARTLFCLYDQQEPLLFQQLSKLCNQALIKFWWLNDSFSSLCKQIKGIEKVH